MWSRILVVFVLVDAGLSLAHGTEVYRSVDEKGNVTYGDRPPPRDSGTEVEARKINPDESVTEFVQPKAVPPEPVKEPPAAQSKQYPPADPYKDFYKDFWKPKFRRPL